MASWLAANVAGTPHTSHQKIPVLFFRPKSSKLAGLILM
jgi:hypothetical protein